jgi:hypothetical protein
MTIEFINHIQTLGTGEIEQHGQGLKSFQPSPVKQNASTSSQVEGETASSQSSSFLFHFFSKVTATSTSSTAGTSPLKKANAKSFKKNSSTLTTATVPLDNDSDDNDNDDANDEDTTTMDVSDRSPSPTPNPKLTAAAAAAAAADGAGAGVNASSKSKTVVAITAAVSNNKNYKFDTSTDLAYHNQQEYDDCELLIKGQHLTATELELLPDKYMVLRHYRAEKGDVTKAVDAIRHTLEWRTEFGVDRIINAFTTETNNEMASVIKRENETGKIYIRGYDDGGRACMYMRPGRENCYDSEYNNLAHLVFQLEKAIACSEKVRPKVV